jgi:hypothetical protein
MRANMYEPGKEMPEEIRQKRAEAAIAALSRRGDSVWGLSDTTQSPQEFSLHRQR